VITIEPGCYFIPMLLQPFRESSLGRLFNWELIDQLSPLGGIRIEDDVLVTAAGGRNLTREQLPG
jgi:Xaa-Pro dipeptidase